MNKYCTRYDNHTIANAKQYCNIRITKYRVIYGINVVFECERARKCERERERGYIYIYIYISIKGDGW